MIDAQKTVGIIESYKQYFPEHWEDEKYKWEAVKHFQDNWDIDAPNFGEMFAKATSKAGNLLVSKNVYPTGMILEFARADDNATREMFRNLFDENLDLAERITEFRTRSEEMRQKYGNGEWKKHYQTTNYISTYLWLKYPDKYYIYKYMIFKECAALFDDSYRPKANGAVDNVIGGFQMYDEIRKVLMADDEFREMLSSALTDLCYPDPEFVTATIDFGFYTATYYNNENEWIPSLEEYAPGLSVEDWVELLRNPEVFDGNSLFLVKAFYDMGGQATCSEIAEKYGDIPMHYAGIATGLARRVQKETNCPLSERDTGEDRLWSVLFTGKKAASADKGVFIWKLRDELKEAVEIMMNDAETETGNAWLLFYDPEKWDWIKDGNYYDALNRLKQTGKPFSISWVVSAETTNKGDEVYIVKTKNYQFDGIVASGRIISEEYIATHDASLNYQYYVDIEITGYIGNESTISNSSEKIQSIFSNFKRIKLTFPVKLSTEIKKSLAQLCLFETDNSEGLKESNQESIEESKPDIQYESYTKEDFLKEVFLTEPEYDKLRSLVLRKKNIILQGAPGVGKTFSAKRLAYSIIGEKNENRICMVQFHQNYSYEDFIMGYRPNDSGGFELQSGVFYNFCIRCKENPDKPYFFIIDEINRGNLSKIFGELLMLIETDKRGEKHKLNLVYGGTAFYIPENLHIIGMMNTADRSLAMIDYALRRRFSFYTMQPAFENADQNGFGAYTQDISCDLYHSVIAKIRELNDTIRKDSTLGKGFEIGHSYFAPENKSDIDDEWVRGVVEYEIIPLIEEYWFDDDKKVDEWTKALYQVIGD